MRKIKIYLSALLFAFLNSWMMAQGCSDAGFCTLNGLTPNSEQSSKQHEIHLGVTYGDTDREITVLQPYIVYQGNFSQDFNLSARLNYTQVEGNNIENNGLSDILLSGNFKISEHWGFNVGAKIPLNDASENLGTSDLPMYYQISLGTLDAIFGINYHWRNLRLAAAYQVPLTENENTYLPKNFMENEHLASFTPTNNFKRSADAMARASYEFKIGDKFSITPGLLAIYHLNEDTYSDDSGREFSITDSDGLTLNATGHINYRINDSHSLHFNAGSPIENRTVIPDGTRRNWVAGLEYRIKF